VQSTLAIQAVEAQKNWRTSNTISVTCPPETRFQEHIAVYSEFPRTGAGSDCPQPHIAFSISWESAGLYRRMNSFRARIAAISRCSQERSGTSNLFANRQGLFCQPLSERMIETPARARMCTQTAFIKRAIIGQLRPCSGFLLICPSPSSRDAIVKLAVLTGTPTRAQQLPGPRRSHSRRAAGAMPNEFFSFPRASTDRSGSRKP